jgi:hypothetical protein
MLLSMLMTAATLSAAMPARAGAAVHPAKQCVTYNAEGLPRSGEQRRHHLDTARRSAHVLDHRAGDADPRGDTQRLTLFGQGLGAGPTVTIHGVATAGSPSAGTANRLDVPVTIGAAAGAGAHDLLVTNADGDQTGCRGCLRVSCPAALPAAGPQGAQGSRGEMGPQGATGTVAATATPRTVTARAKAVRARRLG